MRRCARREIDQIISLNRGRESSFPAPAQTPTHVDHSRSYVVFFQPGGDRIIAPVPSLPLSLSLSRACQERDASILQTFRDYVCTHGDAANRLIMWAFESSLYFLPCHAQEELLSRKSFAEFRKLSSGRPPSRFGYRCIACLESSSERSNPLNKE